MDLIGEWSKVYFIYCPHPPYIVILENYLKSCFCQWQVGLVVHDSSIPVGATTEYVAGHYMVPDYIMLNYFLCIVSIVVFVTNSVVSQEQDASSLLSVIALSPQKREKIVDVA